MLFDEKRDSSFPSGLWIVLFWLPAETLSLKRLLGDLNNYRIATYIFTPTFYDVKPIDRSATIAVAPALTINKPTYTNGHKDR